MRIINGRVPNKIQGITARQCRRCESYLTFYVHPVTGSDPERYLVLCKNCAKTGASHELPRLAESVAVGAEDWNGRVLSRFFLNAKIDLKK